MAGQCVRAQQWGGVSNLAIQLRAARAASLSMHVSAGGLHAVKLCYISFYVGSEAVDRVSALVVQDNVY
jgi:hypothetical protein